MSCKRRDESLQPIVPEEGTGVAAMLDRLHGLLQRQLALVQQGHLAAAVALFDETDQCVWQIAETRGLDVQGGTKQWQGIERVYQELSLVLAAQRTEVAAALGAIQRGRSTLRIYGSHVLSRMSQSAGPAGGA